ncbi:anhydro-N-acetylmuramic acid kinase [Thalassotalea sp. HSM 43]|uniref:anhydro-N-acetylmuramic acid kinase n=1 Tax=Thalassotalea sp. HSM 43 TaxID=2552945 RepID=UPI0010808DD7|nr:anhydro-N-acetylmuramic acid kinase [Thalassotalea sp. HSM 43]QBY04934.1 anhydro-N-acetylmuramic acid kinase [Thalassotalea sp. HSM 43]
MSQKHLPNNNAELYIGLMSGTSADGIDLALVEFNDKSHVLHASFYQPYSPQLKQQIQSLYTPGDNELDRLAALDKQLAQHFASAVLAFLKQQQLNSHDIKAIGNHGQTIRHRPSQQHSFTCQIGCSQTLAVLTDIPVIGRFREKDMALGGQGAPLVPAYHNAMFRDKEKDVCIVNIGGIANITYLGASDNSVIGFDTGPGNALLDDWYTRHYPSCTKGIDEDAKWAKTGQVNQQLLTLMLQDSYFAKAFPKSTGREYFHDAWLQQFIAQQQHKDLAPADIQATLTALTSHSIAEAIGHLNPQSEVVIVGGGAHNPLLMTMLKQLLADANVQTGNQYGIDNDALEALIFAWLAYAFEHNLASNLPSVTGASRATTLGTLFTP